MNSIYFYHSWLSRCSPPFWKDQRLSHLSNSSIKIFYELPSGKYHMRGSSCAFSTPAFGIYHNFHSTWTYHHTLFTDIQQSTKTIIFRHSVLTWTYHVPWYIHSSSVKVLTSSSPTYISLHISLFLPSFS